MNHDMDARPQPPTTPLGRMLHDLARRDVPDNRDLRDNVMRSIQQHGTDRARSDAAERAWNLPALDPARQRRRPSAPDTSEEHNMTGTPSAQPEELIPFQRRRWFREALMIAAAAITFAIIGAILALVLRGGDPNDQSIVPGVAPATPTTLASPTSDRTATVQAAHTALAELTVVANAAITATAASLPSPGEIVATIDVGKEPQQLAATDDAVWIGNAGDGTVSRIDPATNTVVATIQVGEPGGVGPAGSPSLVVTFDNQIWAINNSEGEIVRIDPASNQVDKRFALFRENSSGLAAWLAVDANGLWLTDFNLNQLRQIDPEDGSTLAELDIEAPNHVVSGFGSIWVMAGHDYGPYRIVRVDPASMQIVNEIPIDVNEGVSLITSADAVWVSDWGSDRILRIDPTTNTIVATIENPLNTSHDIVVTPDSVWVSSVFADGVVRIDPATNKYSRTIDVEHGGSVGMVEAFGSIWVTHGDDIVVRIDPTP